MKILVIDILILMIGCCLGFALAYKLIYIKFSNVNKNVERLNAYLGIVNQWLILKEMGIGVDIFIKNMKARRIIIYGMGIYGRHLVRELEKTDVEIVCGIDQRKMPAFHNINIVKLSEHLPQADLIINTVLGVGDEISVKLQKYYRCPIINLDKIIFNSYTLKKDEAMD